MDFSPKKINLYLFLKLPSAFWCGVRVRRIDSKQCLVAVKHSWKNQNPFHSMYFAVQAMGAELATGALVMYHIEKSGRKISMLVLNNKATFTKKATGRITFTCHDGLMIEEGIEKTIASQESQTVWMHAVGTNEEGETVSDMHFEWTLKLK
ncbi:MAG: DUF4442 domain-containing protein [Burkholderiales bacterium]|nr:DUF4442 domain-containing protein [Flavobacterium sp.]